MKKLVLFLAVINAWEIQASENQNTGSSRKVESVNRYKCILLGSKTSQAQ